MAEYVHDTAHRGGVVHKKGYAEPKACSRKNGGLAKQFGQKEAKYHIKSAFFKKNRYNLRRHVATDARGMLFFTIKRL